MTSQHTPLKLGSPKARPRKNSADYLNNKQFAYLLDSNEETLDPNTPNGDMKFKRSKNKQKVKNDHQNKLRTTSIQVETTKTQNEQLEAIKKEVQYLQSSVPHFTDLYSSTQLQWASIKRKNKAESEAFALIQTLSEWIHLYGMKALKEYDEFKQSAETELLCMIGKMEGMNHEITKLNLLYEESETEKIETLNQLNELEIENIKYRKEQSELNEDKQSTELNKNTIADLENELESLSTQYKALNEKYERVEKYWKMTQSENDELRNKNYAIEEDTEQLKIELKHNRESMNSMNIKHERVMTNLQMEHQNYAQLMEAEQDKLIAAQQTANETAQNMTMTPTGSYTIDADINDSDMVRNGAMQALEEEYEGVTPGGIVSLDNLENEINVYQYEDDEWLDDSDSDVDHELEDLEEPEPEPVVVEEYNKQGEFELEKIGDYHDIIYEDIPKGYKTSKIPFEEKKLEFENEKMKIEVESKRASMVLSMSKTQISYTPTHTETDGGFESVRTEIMQKENEAKLEPIVETRIVTKKIIIERTAKQEDKVLKPGKNFAERLAMFRHLDETRGGKPQILPQSKAYSMVNYWKTQNKNQQSVIHNINANSANVHVTKSSRGQSIAVVKITKKKVHTLNPRLFGYMNIVRSSFIPQWKLKKQPKYFFVLDGVPSETNINQKEPDFAKNRKHDFLVPALFFFENKDEYDTFEGKMKNIATRSVEFQRTFAQFAKGIYPLHSYAMEGNIVNCMQRVSSLLKKPNVRLPIGEINGCGAVDNLTILLCSDTELHRFSCNDAFSRNRWIKKVNRICDKRSKRLLNINQGLMSVYDETGNRITNTDTVDTPSGGLDTPPTVIGDFEMISPYNAIAKKD